MNKTKLLFIPGYFGSTLIDRKTKENRWVRVSDFFANKYDLRMHESYSDLPTVNDVIDDQILLTVKLIPKILEIESYSKTLKHLQKFCDETNRDLFTVTYDWREDFHNSILKIAKKIEELTVDGSKIEIVAHSNGGVLISYYLRYGIQDFFEASENWFGVDKISKLSIVASPLRGAYSLFRHMKYGTAVLKNKKMMSSLDYTSFRSTYFFLPGIPFQKGYIEKSNSNFLSFDLFDIELWKKNKWGPYIDEHQKEIPVNDEKFKVLLNRSKKFQELMLQECKLQPQNKISIQVVRAFGKPTYFYPTFSKDKNLATYEYPKSHRAEGDGVVAFEAAPALPWFFNHHLEECDLKAEHLKVISDYKFQKHIHQFLSK